MTGSILFDLLHFVGSDLSGLFLLIIKVVMLKYARVFALATVLVAFPRSWILYLRQTEVEYDMVLSQREGLSYYGPEQDHLVQDNYEAPASLSTYPMVRKIILVLNKSHKYN